MGGGLWQGFFLQTGAKSKVNEASQKRSLEFVWNIRILSNCTLNLTTLKIANVQIPVQKRGLASNFFSWMAFNISRELKF